MTNDGIKSNSLSRLDRLKKTKLYSVSSYPNLLLQTYDDGVGVPIDGYVPLRVTRNDGVGVTFRCAEG